MAQLAKLSKLGPQCDNFSEMLSETRHHNPMNESFGLSDLD